MVSKKGKNELTYWQNRFLQIKIDNDKLEQQYVKEMQDRYKQLSQSIRNEIDDWIRRYAINDAITENDARQLLSKQEQKNWSMTLKEFKRKAIEGGYEQELNREYFKSRISRLQQLQNQLYFEMAAQATLEEKRLNDFLEKQFKETYLRNIYELTDRGSFSVSFDKYNSRALKRVISNPWKESHFSKRIWTNNAINIPQKLTKVFAESTLKGWGIDKTVNKMMEGVDSELRYRMTTLVQTESAHIAEEATQQSYRETGVEKYEWLATLEVHTCSDCGDLDGETFYIDDEMAPKSPLHPNCRCTTVPVIEGWESKSRWHRDPRTGKGKIIGHLNFNDWKAKYVEAA